MKHREAPRTRVSIDRETRREPRVGRALPDCELDTVAGGGEIGFGKIGLGDRLPNVPVR